MEHLRREGRQLEKSNFLINGASRESSCEGLGRRGRGGSGVQKSRAGQEAKKISSWSIKGKKLNRE